MILSRYNTSIMDLDVELGIALIKKAYEKQNENMIWDMWLTKYPWMDEKSFISFSDFKDKLLNQTEHPKKSVKTKEEIIYQAENIVNAWKGGKY